MFAITFENCQLPTVGSCLPLVTCTNTCTYMIWVQNVITRRSLARSLAGWPGSPRGSLADYADCSLFLQSIKFNLRCTAGEPKREAFCCWQIEKNFDLIWLHEYAEWLLVWQSQSQSQSQWVLSCVTATHSIKWLLFFVFFSSCLTVCILLLYFD